MCSSRGSRNRQAIPLGDYLMDRYEVSNGEFKQFVDSGGYRRRESLGVTLGMNGRIRHVGGAMAPMTDRTGRTGPDLGGGRYPAAAGQVPVAGVSWYEAAAYARFAGKALPTMCHWNHAATVRNSAWIVPGSNFSGRGRAPSAPEDGSAASAPMTWRATSGSGV